MIQNIANADVAGKRALLRMSLNVPVDSAGKVSDTFRLKRSLPTLELLVSKGASVVVAGYFGRSGETLRPVFEALEALAPNIPMKFFAGMPEDAGEEAKSLKGGEVLVLENIRKHPGEEKNDPALAQALASLADLYIDDAFAEAHRPYASNVGVAALLPAYAGLLLEEEISKLTPALTPPQNSLAIIGGAKFETKEPLIKKLLSLYAKLLLGGALGNDVLKARGQPFGASLISAVPVPTDIAENTEQLIVPTDAILLADDGSHRESFITDTRASEKIVDIGSRTRDAWEKEIRNAPFILWNGPVGMYEQFAEGTDALADAISKTSATVLIGGGDTAAAVAKFSFDPSRVFISSGGGAMLEFLAKGTLPAIEALNK